MKIFVNMMKGVISFLVIVWAVFLAYGIINPNSFGATLRNIILFVFILATLTVVNLIYNFVESKKEMESTYENIVTQLYNLDKESGVISKSIENSEDYEEIKRALFFGENNQKRKDK